MRTGLFLFLKESILFLENAIVYVFFAKKVIKIDLYLRSKTTF